MQLAANPAAPQQSKGAIEGTVSRLGGNGEALAQAEVTLSRVLPPPPTPQPGQPKVEQEEPAPIRPVRTQEDGKFSFKDLDTGQYRLKVVRNGFATQRYGQRTTFGEGALITVAAGQTVRNVSVRLQQAATVSGHVFDSSGQPITGVLVTLSKSVYNNSGTRGLEQAGTSMTDDRGEYRIFWVPPGRFLLSASPESRFQKFGMSPDNLVSTRNYARTFYPATTDLERATPLDMQPGRELSGMDIVLTMPPVFRIKGMVVSENDGQAPKNVEISLTPRQQAGRTKFGDDSSGYDSHYAAGAFEIDGVIPGSYWLRASQSPDWNGPLPPGLGAARTAEDLFAKAFQSLASAQLAVDIVAADLDSVKLNLSSGFSIPVRVRVDGQEISSLSRNDAVRLALWPADVNNLNSWGGRQGDPLEPDGTTKLESVSPGVYRVWLEERSVAPDLYVKEASYEGQDVLNEWWTITTPVHGTLNVVLGNKAGQIEGTLLDAQSKPVSGAGVVLIPDQSRHRDELYRTADTDESGHFTLRGIVPGTYRIFSWEDLEPYAYYDKEVLARFEQQGKPVRIGESSKQDVEVRIIPAGR